MIVTDDTPKSPAKDLPTDAPPEYQRSPPQPPPGGPSQPLPHSVPSYGAAPYSQEAYYRHVAPARGPNARKRFCKAFLAAFVIWLLVSFLVRSIVAVASSRHTRWYAQDNYPIPFDVKLGHCASSLPSIEPSDPSWPYAAHTSFNLPISSSALLLYAKGALSNGRVEITQSSDVPSDTARVDIIVNYHKLDVLALAKVCAVTRGDGENGAGIFTPNRWWTSPSRENRLHFDVKVILPEATASSVVSVRKLETDVSNISHDLKHLSNAYFDMLSLKGSNKPITGQALSFFEGSIKTSNALISIKDLKAQQGAVKTSNGPIIGRFEAKGNLVLETSNAPIKATVRLGEEDNVTKPALYMTTSNGMIESTVDLVSASESTFTIAAKTSNGPLKIDVPSAPSNSSIFFEGKTSNNMGDVTLPETFEGSFDLTTSNSAAAVHHTDRGATFRQFYRDKGHTRVYGIKYFEEKNQGRGAAVLKTSNSPLILRL